MQIEKLPLDSKKLKLSGFPKNGLHLVCAGDLLINTAESDYQKLTQFLASEKPLVLDLAGIEEIDSSGLQLLIAFKSHCKKIGQDCLFINPSPVVSELFDLFFLTDTFAAKAVA